MDFLFPTSRTGLLFTLCGAPSQAEKCGAHGKMYVIFKGPLLTNQWLAAILRHDNPLNLSYHFGSVFFFFRKSNGSNNISLKNNISAGLL